MPDHPVREDFEVLAKAVDDAAAAVAELPEPGRAAAQGLRAAIEAAHKAALVTIVRRLRDDEAGRAVLFELVDDPLIRMLFSLHGIIKTTPPTGVGAAGEHVAGHAAAGDGCGCGTGHDRPRQPGPAFIPLGSLLLPPGGSRA